jgi:MinD-like ATPase involved in chromosome partitioning or flagellar assembly
VELPTYTNIWKIEKRLYKLYDFRLPMPLPVGQIAAFLAIAVPYMLILTAAGMPFSHTWLWLYLLPPGVLAWLVTRPVLEGKRLPELVRSQLRYVSEPRTWCRMAPLAEKDHMVVVARVWRSAAPAPQPAAHDPQPAQSAAAGSTAADQQAHAPVAPDVPAPRIPVRVRVGPARPVPIPADAGSQPAEVRPGQADAGNGLAGGWPHSGAARLWPTGTGPGLADGRAPLPERRQEQPGPAPGPSQETKPPVVRVTSAVSQARPLNVVERALRSSPADRGAGAWREPVLVVPGGHRPGKPDHVQRDQARARLPIHGSARIVVLGCTAGAGQTAITLLTGQLLASLRGEAVAVVDLSPGGAHSLTEQARSIPVLLPSRRAGADADGAGPAPARERGLQVVTAASAGQDADHIINSVVARYPLTLADPDAGSVPKALRAADQLILVAPASAEAAGSLAMTLEWLEAHDHGRLAAAAVTVLNGVSPQSAQHVDKAAAVVTGRSRAIIRVPWDERLRGRSPAGVGTVTVQAYTALAGVLVAGLADTAAGDRTAQGAVR